MFLFHPIHFLKFLVNSQSQRSYKKGFIKKQCRLALKLFAGETKFVNVFISKQNNRRCC